MTTKSDQRRAIRALLKKISPDEKRKREQKLVLDMSCWLQSQRPSRLLVYAPLEREPNWFEAWSLWVSSGWTLWFPCIEGSGQMSFAHVSSPHHLINRGRFREPTSEAIRLEFSEPTDICLIPCLALDRDNFRLGQGGGYYDRFMPGFYGQSVALLFEEQKIDTLAERAETDCRVDHVIWG